MSVFSSDDWMTFFKIYFKFLLATLDLCRHALAFSHCGEWGYSLLWCGGFSSRWPLLCVAWALPVWVSVAVAPWLSGCNLWNLELWHMSLVAPHAVESSWTRDQTHVPCIAGQILIHCTTRKVLNDLFWKLTY